MNCFVGIDCGGSTTRVMAVDETGEIRFQGYGGPANLTSTPLEKIKEHLSQAAKDCPAPTHVCGCFAGLIDTTTRANAETLLNKLFPQAILRTEPDYAAAFYASPPGTDVCVIAGTGSLVCSVKDNHMVKSGGRGFIIGDPGSAYQLGREAIIWYLEDPSIAPPSLHQTVKDVFGSTEEQAIVSSIYGTETPAMDIAQFAKNLVEAAQIGSQRAKLVLQVHMGNLATVTAKHIVTHNNIESVTLSLSGGLWNTSPLVLEAFAQAIHQRLPNHRMEIYRPTEPPVRGAVELAKQLAG